MKTLEDFVRESNMIEGIHEVRENDLKAAWEFMKSDYIDIPTLIDYVSLIQPDAVLRQKVGLDVRVGDYIAPRGGPHIYDDLEALLGDLAFCSPYENHMKYETLHPFTDGNGRSGRMLFYWQCEQEGNIALYYRSFLHEWYYLTLANQQD